MKTKQKHLRLLHKIELRQLALHGGLGRCYTMSGIPLN